MRRPRFPVSVALKPGDDFSDLFLRMAVRRLLSWPAVLLLGAGVVLNVAKHWWLLYGTNTGRMHPLVEQLGPSIDFFGWAMLLIAAPLFTSLRLEGTLTALRLAGLSWRQIFSPLFRLVYLICVVDALVEVAGQVIFGYEPLIVDAWRLVIGSIFGLASAWNFTSWLFLLNVLRMPKVFQLLTATALIFATLTASYPVYMWLDGLLQVLYARFPVILTPLSAAAASPQHGQYFAQLWMSEFLFILLLAGFFALLAPLVYRVALRLADRTQLG